MDPKKRQYLILAALGLPLAAYLGLFLAPAAESGSGLAFLAQAMRQPWKISLCAATGRTVGLSCLVYFAGVLAFFPDGRKERRLQEHGSARWGDTAHLRKRYEDPVQERNKILTQDLRIGLDGRKHRRNLNVLVVGGAGAGKSRYYVRPNILQANCSYVILDPKAELLASTGGFLRAQGYEVRVLDLVHMEKSHCFNPFVYLRSDNDVQRLVTNLFQNTGPRGKTSSDPFWDNAAQMLLMALVFYLHYEAPPEEQNFSMVMELLRAGHIRGESKSKPSRLDLLFQELEQREPGHIAVKYYSEYQVGAAKTLQSIQISLATRLEKFNLRTLEAITRTDELDLDDLGKRKMAIFAVIPDSDTSFNFIVGMLYTLLFERLYRAAMEEPDGRLPCHVHFLMDEFANIALPADFDKLLATMRSREISVSIILQNLSQLKTLYEKQWENITGNCDTFLYLGGNEQSTHEYVSKMLGRQTISYRTNSKSRGRNASASESVQLTGRELLLPDEVRKLDNDNALVFLRGEDPVMDRKYDLASHPAYRQIPEGGGTRYVHGLAEHAIAELEGKIPEETTEILPHVTVRTAAEIGQIMKETQRKGEET